MRAFAVALLALGVLDTLLAIARDRWWSTSIALAGAAAGAFGLAALAGFSPRAALVLSLTLLVEAPLWVAARRVKAPARCIALLVPLAVALFTRFLTAGLWRVRPDSALDHWVRTTPFPVITSAGADRVAYVVAAAFFLAGAGNMYVRLFLRGIDLAPDGAKQPGGGRVIGSIERVLIFALAGSGAAAAAALVVSAKGILRFADVRSKPDEDVDGVTEYVLIGSLASYAVALAFVPFV